MGTPAAIFDATFHDWIVGPTFNGCVGNTKVTYHYSRSGVPTKVNYS